MTRLTDAERETLLLYLAKILAGKYGESIKRVAKSLYRLISEEQIIKF